MSETYNKHADAVEDIITSMRGWSHTPPRSEYSACGIFSQWIMRSVKVYREQGVDVPERICFSIACRHIVFG